jgi:hypothetical protein
MRTKTAIITSALVVPLLAAGGGITYASTTPGSPATATPAAATTTARASQPATGPVRINLGSHRQDQRCDGPGHRYQQPATQRQATQQQARSGGYRHDDGCQGRDQPRHPASWSYSGNGQHRDGSWCDTGSGCYSGWH